MTMKLIGAGFGRTGTNTQKVVLEKLGLGPCYHMYEVMQHPGHVPLWYDAACGVLPDWNTLFEGFSSGVDWPVCSFWRELSEFYPDAKFILTPREEEAWYASINKTIFDTFRMPYDPENPNNDLRLMTRKLILENTFDGNIEDKDHVLGVYRKHNAAVLADLPSDRVLTYDVKQGWPPLCEFLGVDVPEEDFPHTNTTKDFRERMAQAK